jgi:hypothetical protein
VATKDGIAEALDLLLAAGCPKPKTATISSIGVAWAVTLPEVDDDRLMAACLLYLRSDQSQYWPKPGQLLSLLTAREDDRSGEDWGLVRRLRRLHGVREPARPSDPRTWLLSTDRAEAQARWRGLEASGGWQHFQSSRSYDRFSTGYMRAVDSAKEQLAAGKWSEAVKAEISRWLLQADPGSAFRDLVLASEACGSEVPRNPLEPAPYRLHENPIRERAIAAGLAAAGGWREIWPDGSTIPESLRASDAANRRAFVEAYRASIRRATKTSEARRVAQLVDLTGEALALPLNLGGE